MEISAKVHRSATTRASPEEVYALLADVPRSVAHFPDLDALTFEHGAYTWRLKKLGAGPISFQVHYAARYTCDPAARSVVWVPVAGVGNTRVSGQWRIEPAGAGTRFTLETEFALDLPLPRPLRGAAEALLHKENDRILGEYLGNLVVTMNGGDGRPRR